MHSRHTLEKLEEKITHEKLAMLAVMTLLNRTDRVEILIWINQIARQQEAHL